MISVPYFARSTGPILRLVPVRGGREIAFTAPNRTPPAFEKASGGRILFRYDTPTVAKMGEWPPRITQETYAVREADGRVRTVLRTGRDAKTYARPDGAFLLVYRPVWNVYRYRVMEVARSGRISVLADGVIGPRRSGMVVPTPTGWLYAYDANRPFVHLRPGRRPRTVAVRPPLAVSADGRLGAFGEGRFLRVARLRPSERGLGRGPSSPPSPSRTSARSRAFPATSWRSCGAICTRGSTAWWWTSRGDAWERAT